MFLKQHRLSGVGLRVVDVDLASLGDAFAVEFVDTAIGFVDEGPVG